MNCKQCNSPLNPGDPVCPVCGTQNVQQKNNTGKIIVATVICVLLVVALVLVVLIGANVINLNIPTEPVTNQDTQQSQETDPPADLVSYTATDDAHAKASAGNIVATAGTKQLTNAELQTYYWINFYNFINENYYYLSYYGLDFTKPLDQQVFDQEKGITWQQQFLDSALEVWHRYIAVVMMAEQDDFTLSPEDQAYLDSFPDRIRQMVADNGYESVDAFLTAEMGAGATLEGYVAYQQTYYYTMCYVEHIYDSLIPTYDELEAYYTENETAFTSNGVGKEDGDLVDVRHILIVPEGGTEDAQGNVTYNEDEFAACYDKANALLEQWKQGEATEESFAKLAGEYSKDPGSVSNGGLYSGVAQGDMLETFDAWIFSEIREYGDTGLVKTKHGYHIMYFVSREPAWEQTATSMLVSEKLNEKIDTAMTTWPLQTDYEQIVLGKADLGLGEE